MLQLWAEALYMCGICFYYLVVVCVAAGVTISISTGTGFEGLYAEFLYKCLKQNQKFRIVDKVGMRSRTPNVYSSSHVCTGDSKASCLR